MSNSLFIKSRQRILPVNARYLRWLTRSLLQDLLWVEDFDLAVYIVRTTQIARLNKTYLHHDGPTDVITFDYGEHTARPKARTSKAETLVHGEIFVCVDEAVLQARRFRTTWQKELARYVIHGILHLLGYDDCSPAERRTMKRQEDRLLREIARSFPLQKLAAKSK